MGPDFFTASERLARALLHFGLAYLSLRLAGSLL